MRCVVCRWSRPAFFVCLLLNVLCFIVVFASNSPLLASDSLSLTLQFTAASTVFLVLFGGARALLALLVAALRTQHRTQLHASTQSLSSCRLAHYTDWALLMV